MGVLAIILAIAIGVLFLWQVVDTSITMYQNHCYEKIIITQDNAESYDIFATFILDVLVNNNVFAIYVPFKGHRFIFRDQLDMINLQSTIRLKVYNHGKSSQ
jgi:hypothetical protein